jgi:hypothetical protein
MRNKEAHDARSGLYDALIKVKIPEKEAWLIAIDAGGQGVIDREYLHSYGIRKKGLQDKVLLEVAKFQIGDFD